MLVGIDDTDSPKGGCTTHFALEAAAAFRRSHGLVLRRRPRLVRLNPNVPWKTRGNAAVALDLGAPSAAGARLGGVAPDGTEVLIDGTARAEAPGAAHARTLDKLVEAWCDLSIEGTDPAYLLCSSPLPPALYLSAVTGVVDPAAVLSELDATVPKPLWKALGSGRGIVGAAAAVAWPAERPTFELIVYRERARWGTKRDVDFDSVERMDRAFPATYHNIDRANRHVAIAPSTPCPLLFGVRAFEADGLAEAAASVRTSEAWAGWLLFETNQGTDAHIVLSTIARAQPMQTVSVEGAVSGRAKRLKGGHVVVTIADGGGATLECAAYEPTKAFRDVVAALERGDRVRAVGAIRADRRTLNLEKLQIIKVAPRQGAPVNPPCATCGRRMKSAGKDGPLRCRSCGAKVEKAAARRAQGPAAPREGCYEVPIAARRHLARPIDPHGY
jgi:tRNA(Ile2)-agmatinylcytidine synthase